MRDFSLRLRDFNIRFNGTIETCINASEVRFDNDSVSFYVDNVGIIFYASLSDITYVKEFFIEDCSFKTLYSTYKGIAG